MRNNNLSLPVVQGVVLSYLLDGHEARLAIGTPAWYTWLDSVTCFAYRGPFGSFTARKERAGNKRGDWYWRAYRKRGGKLHRVYLGRSADLTGARLDAAAARLTSQREEKEARGEPGPGGESSLLPVQWSSFVGREQELETISALLLGHHLLPSSSADSGQPLRLLTLTGPGGVGKTRLALHLAAQLPARFAHGVVFVNLAPIRDAALVASAIAQALGVTESPGQPLIASLQAYLRDREVLLVLDNFEQVVTAASTVAELLASCPRLKMLITSREVLRLSGERAFPVPPLACPAPEHQPDVAQLTQYAAVRLFIERARAVLPDFGVTNAGGVAALRAVAEICVRLDGLPLAIELAAARVRHLSPEAILERLERLPPGGYPRLRLLVGGARDLPARQQTLRNTIEWSYDLLDEAEKQLFRRMSVFVGGCTLEAIEAVCNHDGDLKIDVLDGVSSLVDKSLLRKVDGFAGATRRIPGFVLLETIREYAGEKLEESGETADLRRRHALYFLALAEEAEPQLRGAQQAEWLDRLEQAHDNIRAALAWSRDTAGGGDDADASRLEIGLRFGSALQWFWDTQGHFTEGRAHLDPLLSCSASLGPTSSRAGALMSAGRLAWDQGDLAEAHSMYEESLAIFRPLDDKLRITYALNGLANTVKLQGDYAAAASFLEQSLMVARELGENDRIGAALENLGEIVLAQGDYARARELHEEGLRLFREVDDKLGIGLSLQDLGIVALRQGDHNQARRLFEEALTMYREIGEKRFSGVVLYELGQVARAQGDDSRAATLFKESLSAAHSLSDRIFIGLGLGGLAALAGGEGRMARAARLFGAADAIIDAAGGRWFQVDWATFDRARTAAHGELGEEPWQTAVEEGRAMPVDRAVAYALEPGPEARPALLAAATDHPTAEPSPASAGAGPTLRQLTEREVEVLRLVVEGLTAPQVAAGLFLSVRTVENHLRSIYAKLNVSTRAAATRMALERGLLRD